MNSEICLSLLSTDSNFSWVGSGPENTIPTSPEPILAVPGWPWTQESACLCIFLTSWVIVQLPVFIQVCEAPPIIHITSLYFQKLCILNSCFQSCFSQPWSMKFSHSSHSQGSSSELSTAATCALKYKAILHSSLSKCLPHAPVHWCKVSRGLQQKPFSHLLHSNCSYLCELCFDYSYLSELCFDVEWGVACGRNLSHILRICRACHLCEFFHGQRVVTYSRNIFHILYIYMGDHLYVLSDVEWGVICNRKPSHSLCMRKASRLYDSSDVEWVLTSCRRLSHTPYIHRASHLCEIVDAQWGLTGSRRISHTLHIQRASRWYESSDVELGVPCSRKISHIPCTQKPSRPCEFADVE